MQHADTLKEINANWKATKENERETYICWLSIKDAFTPTECCKNHISSIESPPPEKMIRVKEDNNMIWGQFEMTLDKSLDGYG